MSELENLMSRFRLALSSVQARIDAAESYPSLAEFENLKASREADLKQFEQLKAELERSSGEVL